MKILFASQAIGHFNPMTGVAVRLKERGHDVGWYTGPVLADRLRLLGIRHFPFRRAIEHRADNLNELYPERARLKGPRAIGFDGEKIFASNISNFFEDIRELHEATYGQDVPRQGRLTDEPYRCADAIIQTGPASLDFPRRYVNPKVHYVGALLPHRTVAAGADPDEWPRTYPATLVVTQGTVDNVDQDKLIIPALEAVKGMDALVIVATGGRGTAALKARYPQANILVRDYVDFASVFGFTDVFITNGGFGGVQLSLSKGVPLVVSGINEGKSDVNARVEYASVGISLRTESPKPRDIAKAVADILGDPAWKERAGQMRDQLELADPAEAAADVVENTARAAGP
jgi:UDP:flavonoid glycosyltransferase YjiC (YdhE family)